MDLNRVGLIPFAVGFKVFINTLGFSSGVVFHGNIWTLKHKN